MLFISSYLSRKNGSLDVTEQVAEKLNAVGMNIRLSSRQENKLLRLADIVVSVLTTQSALIHVDVYSGQAFRIAEVATFLGALRKKKLILTLHGGALPEFFQKQAHRIGKVFKRANVIQTPSLYLKACFEKAGFPIQYLPNAIDLSKFPYDRSSVQPYSLLWVRAFTPIYQPELAVKILQEVRKTYPLTTLTMVGPDKGSLKEVLDLIKDLGLENVVSIKGPIPNNLLYSYYNKHAVYLNTTTYESFGVALVEAAACGVLAVSTTVGEIPYLWTHNENILLVQDFEASSFAKQVMRLFEDQSLAQRLSLNARKKAETFSWENIRPQWINLLSDGFKK